MKRVTQGAFFLLLIWLIAVPLLLLFLQVLYEQGIAFTIKSTWAGFLSATTLRTIALSLGVTLGATFFGTLLGWRLAFRGILWPKLASFSLLIPLVLPAYIFGIAWANLLGGMLYNFGGSLLILSVCWMPLVAFITRRSFSSIDPSIHESAALDGADSLRCFFWIDLPLIYPVLLSAFVLLFVLNLNEFGIPSLFLVHVMTFEVLTDYSALYDPSAAVLSSIPILWIALIVIVGERIFRRGEPIPFLSQGDRSRIQPEIKKTFTSVLTLIVCLLIGLAPLGLLAYETLIDGSFNGINRSLDLVGLSIKNSLILSTLGAAVLTTTSFLTVICLDKRLNPERHRFALPLFEFGLFVLFSIPTAVWALALLQYWNHPVGWRIWVVDTMMILIIGYLGRFFPIPYTICRDAMDSLPNEMIEAACIDGAGYIKIIRSILYPLMMPALLTAFSVSFIFCFGELILTLFCAPPHMATLPMRLYTIMANSPSSIVSATALILVCSSLPLAFVAFQLSSRTQNENNKQVDM